MNKEYMRSALFSLPSSRSMITFYAFAVCEREGEYKSKITSIINTRGPPRACEWLLFYDYENASASNLSRWSANDSIQKQSKPNKSNNNETR